MKTINGVLSVIIEEDSVFYLRKDGGETLSLHRSSLDLEDTEKLHVFSGIRGSILLGFKERILLGIDNKLILYGDNTPRVVLETHIPGNTFWHGILVGDSVFIQEYGRPPTSIYVSEDLVNWKRLVSNLDIDKYSTHFHSISYYPRRDWLITTLGDGCLTRVAYSEDRGVTWRPLYRGPWQFIPIYPLTSEIVFGMDSGIARGGIGVYYVDIDKWKFKFFKWIDRDIHVQMFDLKQIDKDTWIAAFSTPRFIGISRDLRAWYPLYIEKTEYSHNPSIVLGGNNVYCVTGENLVVFDVSELNGFHRSRPVTKPYSAVIDRFIGIGFTLKRILIH